MAKSSKKSYELKMMIPKNKKKQEQDLELINKREQ